MREIKFRGMLVSGEWVYGNFSIISSPLYTKGVDAGCYISNSVGHPFAYKVRPETVGQFTGLLDKNGKEIYEGDVVTEGGSPHIIEYDEERAAYNYKTKTGSALLYLFYGEVIGNIHEHPELLT